MTYAITITEPGAEPVSVSLEWTTEAPKVDGFYYALMPDWCIDPSGAEIVWFGGGHYVHVFFRKSLMDIDLIRGWIGPIPLAPKGD